jgi:hypothetical protein
MDTDPTPDMPALDADQDPAKGCRFDPTDPGQITLEKWQNMCAKKNI